jgi:heme/copper-type cytochrome/quinol oxidase subunit 3
MNFVATLFDLYWLLATSTVATIGCVIVWLWPSREERERKLAGEGTTVHGLPVYTSGTSAPGWWTMAHIVAIVFIVLACLVFSYFYLRADMPAWPPAGYARLDVLLPVLATIVILGLAAAVHWAERGIRRAQRQRLLFGLGGALALALSALALLVGVWMATGMSPAEHAYASLVFTLLGFQLTLLVGALVLIAVVLVQAWLGYFDRHRFLAVQNTSLFTAAAAVNWLVTGGVLFLM